MVFVSSNELTSSLHKFKRFLQTFNTYYCHLFRYQMRKIDKISTSTNTLLVLQEARFAFYIEPITTKRYDVIGVKIITWPLSRWWERNIYLRKELLNFALVYQHHSAGAAKNLWSKSASLHCRFNFLMVKTLEKKNKQITNILRMT